MHPILFRIPLGGLKLPWLGELGNIPIYSYGVMLGLSLVVGWYLTLGLAARDGLPRETMANNYVITAVAAVVGSRVLFILTNLSSFNGLGDLFSLREGGLVAYGGFLGGYLGSWIYLRIKRIRLMPWADVAVPSLASGLMITRIGCYLYGCDYGKPLSEGAPGWLQKIGTFPHWPEGTLPNNGGGSPAWWEHVQSGLIGREATHSLPVHPTQLYESLTGAALLALLLWARKRQKFRGEIFFLFAFAYGSIRFMLELLRADPERGDVPPSLPEHILVPFCLVLLAAGFAISFARRIEPLVMQRAAQVLAFVPAVVAFLVLRPASFAGSTLIRLSTSQFVGFASGLAVCIAYVFLYRHALANPQGAMELGLPGASAAPAAELDGDLEDDDEVPARVKRPAAKKSSAAARSDRPRGKARKRGVAARPKADEGKAAAGDASEREGAQSEGGADPETS